MLSENQPESVGRSATLTIPELEQSKAAVLNTLASVHSRRSYTFAINRFIAWYCSEPRLTFNRWSWDFHSPLPMATYTVLFTPSWTKNFGLNGDCRRQPTTAGRTGSRLAVHNSGSL